MDITQFIASHREALLIGDYNTYRAQLSRQLLAARKRLGRATPKREKFAKKEITAEDVGSNHEFAYVLLLTSERAWAHAMHIKTSHTDDNTGKGLTGNTRTHIISRLAKAAKTAQVLVGLLKQTDVFKANAQDVLEARAYQATLAGAEEFEKQSGGLRSSDGKTVEKDWQACLTSYAEARVIYASLYEKQKKEVYKEILTNTVDPTIRYAAYQAHLSRTIAIPSIAKRYFPKGDAALVGEVEKLDEHALQDKPVEDSTDGKKQAAAGDVPNSVTWRGRKANIVDASIGQALASVSAAEASLNAYLEANSDAESKDKAAAYDDILIASQDAADATKAATDELEKERVDEGDSRMQNLRVTSLAVNYDLISWRVGRNRILIGESDGAGFEPHVPKRLKRARKSAKPLEKEEPRGRQVARLRERVVLYDATIQSINSVKDLRGAMRDSAFVEELDGKVSYFRALKCLNIAYSHSLLDNHTNVLALLKRAQDLAQQASSTTTTSSSETKGPLTLTLFPSTTTSLESHISALLARTHALVELRRLEANSALAAAKHLASAAPLVQNLSEYPPLGTYADLTNLVQYPPKIQPVPVKPLYLDVAYNYIDYANRRPEKVAEKVVEKVRPVVNGVQESVREKVGSAEQQGQQKKKGWFGWS